MASLVERLRVRSDRRPIYTLDESDEEADLVRKKSGAGPSSDSFERFQRPDTKEGLCQGCGKDGDLWSCETCTYSYHVKCLLPAPRGPIPSGWKCPDCVGHLIELDKILDCEMRPRAVDDSNASELGSNQVMIKHYLVKWKGRSYLHCIWVPETEFVKAYKSNPRLRTKVNNFHRQASSSNNNDDENLPIRPDWTSVDRIIACREVELGKEYLVKWKELPYDECSWEMGSDIESYQSEIEKFERIQSRKGSAGKQKSNLRDPMEVKNRHKDFQQYESSPDFLSGGSLHPYQLEGLNFLRFAWSKQTHVILADEMGLGKTIQSIAFLASLFGENISPHLVVAPLSTLRNWEREFATWAPHMNVVMYVGTSQARTVIREYEFYYPKNHKKIKKKKTGQTVSESKQDRIKFDVLLTSYEMINMDSSSLKPIKWECMIVDEGHRLKNKDSKLFSALKQYSSRHRVLLTGTPLQNNLDELFMLMHFLDAGKFASLEDFQEEFKDINQEEQISRLHKMLAPHLLRRVKKDVMKELPPKKELILRVELSSKQKEYYKAILTRNYQILTRKGGPQISLINVVMELRKLCCHPFMLEGVEPEDNNEFTKQLLESSGKLQLLDKMMIKLKEQGHRVLIYSQFQHMLDLLEDYCNYRKWYYERIDGKVTGAERQIRIDRFNAKNSTRFCFLLSTRAGGLGINLATADTVIIYDRLLFSLYQAAASLSENGQLLNFVFEVVDYFQRDSKHSTYFSDNCSVSGDCSDNDGSVMDNSKGHFAKARLAAIVCVQDLCRADPKLFTAQWTMLLPSNDVLQHRKYDTTLMSCLLSDPSLQVRIAAASTIMTMLDGPASISLQVAEFREHSKHGSFTTLSSSLGHILMQLHSGTLYLIKHEASSRLLALSFKILMLLIASTPYSRMPAELLSRVISSVQSTIEEGFSFHNDRNSLLAAAIICLTRALSVSSSMCVNNMLLGEISTGCLDGQRSGVLHTLFRYSEQLSTPLICLEAHQALKALSHNYPNVMALCWEQISSIIYGVLSSSPDEPARLWRGNVEQTVAPIRERVMTAAVKIKHVLILIPRSSRAM